MRQPIPEAPQHPSTLFLPAGEIDNRILESSNQVRLEWANAMTEIHAKINKAAEGMALIVGTAETPGVLSRIESTLERVEERQETTASDVSGMREDFSGRVIADDAFRNQITKDLGELRQRVDNIQALVTFMQLMGRSFKVVLKVVRGETPKTLWAIAIAILYVAIVQYVHAHFPHFHHFPF